MFHVICIDDGASEPCRDELGVALLFDTGALAAAFAANIASSTGKRHKPRPVLDDAWKAREAARFSSGAYVALPWVNTSWWFESAAIHGEHFAHVSTEEPGKIAFTETAEKGSADVQTRMKPGRYLQKYFPDLGEHSIRDYAGMFAGMYEMTELHFADTEQGIEDVYTAGPSSCMAYPARRYDSDCHPVRVYASPDLAVAYIRDENEAITARAIVWREKKIHSTIYGDEARISAAFERAGYTEGALTGARLLRRECAGGYVVPYVDGESDAADNGAFLVIGGRGDISLSETNGLAGEETTTCEHCDERTSNDDTYTVDRNETWCWDCVDNDAFLCDYYDEYFSGAPVRMANGDTWSQRAFDNYGTTCEATDKNIKSDDAITLDDGTTWSRDHYEMHGCTCDTCGGLFDEDSPCEEHAETEEADDTPRPHVAKQGRDENPAQLEMRDGHRLTENGVVPTLELETV